MKCSILRGGDVDTNPWPFGDSSDEEDFVRDISDLQVDHEPILADLGCLEVLINDDMEVVNVLAELGGIAEMVVDDSDAARGSNDPPPPPPAPKRTPFRQKYTLFDKDCLDCGAPFANYVLLQKHAPFCGWIPDGVSAPQKHKCEICGAYFLKHH